jgi:PhoH-like ATPase
MYNFQENDIVIPFVALEELDKFRKGNDIINFHAREFIREFDQLAGNMFFSEGGYRLAKDLEKYSLKQENAVTLLSLQATFYDKLLSLLID